MDAASLIDQVTDIADRRHKEFLEDAGNGWLLADDISRYGELCAAIKAAGIPEPSYELGEQKRSMLASRLLSSSITRYGHCRLPGLLNRGRFELEHGAVFMNWRQAMRELRAVATTSTAVGGQTNEAAAPKKLLTGWHEITAAVDEKYSNVDKIKSLNERRNGPITNRGKGTQPMVYHNALLKWWNALALEQQELANQRDGEALTGAEQYQYGRNAVVAPLIKGSVKKRRT